MSDKNFQLTVEAMRSTTIQYIVITVCFIIFLFFVKKWFIDDKKEQKKEVQQLKSACWYCSKLNPKGSPILLVSLWCFIERSKMEFRVVKCYFQSSAQFLSSFIFSL